MVRQKKKICPLGEILTLFMSRKGLSNRAVAEIAGVSPASIQDWKKGVIPTDFPALSRLADYFGVSLRFLLTGQEEQFQETSEEVRSRILWDAGVLFSGVCEVNIKRLIPFAVDGTEKADASQSQASLTADSNS